MIETWVLTHVFEEPVVRVITAEQGSKRETLASEIDMVYRREKARVARYPKQAKLSAMEEHEAVVRSIKERGFPCTSS